MNSNSKLSLLSLFIILVAFYSLHHYHYLLFHSLAEIFSIVIAGCIFVIVWNTKKLIDNNYLLFIGLAYLFIALLDLLHTLAYSGMGIFDSAEESNLATQLWIASRYFQSTALCAGCFFITRKINLKVVFLIFFSVFLFLIGSIFLWNIFPDCYSESQGITQFKKISEYCIALILLFTIFLLRRYRHSFDKKVFTLLILSIGTTILSELVFTFYIHVYGFANLFGHLLKIVSFYFIYKAIVVTSFIQPQHILYRKLQQNEQNLQSVRDDLQKRVSLRTRELEHANTLLKAQIKERTKAEKELLFRQKVLESVYTIATASGISLEALFDQVVKNITAILELPFVAVGKVDNGYLSTVSISSNGILKHEKNIEFSCHLCGTVIDKKQTHLYDEKQLQSLPACPHNEQVSNKSYIGVPILNSSGESCGIICGSDNRDRTYSAQEIHLFEIFSRYLGHEIERNDLIHELQLAQEMKVLGQLTSGVAHEVRNPLNAILAINDALFQELGNNETYTPYKEHIQTQIKRLSTLMNDLLHLGKSAQQFNFTPSPLPSLYRSALTLWQQTSEENSRFQVTIKEPAHSEQITVACDAEKMQQVFINLLDNAAQHSLENKAMEIDIKTSESGIVYIKIRDWGSGIDEQYADRIFEPFFTSRKKGTGLGLCIVKHIIEMHKGSIAIKNNTPDPGCTVELRLPVWVNKGTVAI